MASQTAILEQVHAVLPLLRSQFNVTGLSLFGSLARNQAKPESDVDLLVTFTDDASLFDLVRLKQYLEETLHLSVDVVPKESLRSELREQILKDAVPV